MPDLPATRQSLLLQLQQRSDDAWVEFIEIYEQAIYEYCRGRGLQNADAQDVTQEVLAAVDRQIGNWKMDPAYGKFRAWLFRVSRNIAVDKIHERSRRAAASGDTRVGKLLAEFPQSDEAQSTAFWNEYRRALFHWAVRKVKPEVSLNAWSSFWHTAVEGQAAQQVAADLQTSVGNVYTAKCRVFKRIRTLIERLDDRQLAEITDDELLPKEL